MKNELKKYMTIGLTDDNMCGVQISPDMQASEAFQLVGTLALHVLNAYCEVATSAINENASSAILDSVPKKQAPKGLTKEELAAAKQGIKESMYDAMDSVFSNVLESFLPDNPRADIEDEAIIELVNKKIEERYDRLSSKEKKLYAQAFDSMKRKLQSTDTTKSENESK